MAKNDGKRFETLTKSFFSELFKKIGYNVHKERIQFSGTQDGFDIQFIIADKHIERKIYIECKDYTNDVSFGNIYTKANDLESNYTLGKKDILFFISPRSPFANNRNAEKTEPVLNNNKFPFEIRLLDIDNGVDKLFATNMDIYEEIYKKPCNVDIIERDEIENFRSILQSKGILRKVIITEDDRRNYVTDIKSDQFLISRTLSESKSDLNTFRFHYSEDREIENTLINLAHKLIENDKIDGVVLLGNPGSGKSFELQQTAVRMWQEREQNNIIPFFRTINTFLITNEIADYLPEYWKHIPNLVILLDGLDEIPDVQIFKNKLKKFLLEDKFEGQNIKFILSCRTNIYESIVKDISHFDCYFLDNIPIQIAFKFLRRKYGLNLSLIQSYSIDKDLNEFLINPYYLNLFGEYFKKNQELPRNKSELIQKYVEKRLVDDYKGKYNNNPEYDINVTNICCKKVSLAMEAMQLNQILDSQLQLLLNEDKQLFKNCCFIDKVFNEEAWKFEHKNLQEYYVARAIENLDFNKIIGFLCIDSSLSKTHPSWLNSITYLINSNTIENLKRDRIIEWLQVNDSEVLLKSDSDRIPNSIRISVFQNYFSRRCIDQTLWIRNYDSDIFELSKFAQCEENISFLIRHLKNPNVHRRARISAISILSRMNISSHFDEIKQLTLELIAAPLAEVDFNFKVEVFNLIEISEIYKIPNYINEVISALGEYDNHRVLSSLFRIIELENPDDHIVFLRKITPKVANRKARKYLENNNYVNDDGSMLKVILKKLKEPNSIVFAFETLLYNEYDLDVKSEDVDEMITLLVNGHFNDENLFYNRVLSLIESSIKDNRSFYTFEDNVIAFFRKTKTEDRAFLDLYESKISFKNKAKFLTDLASKSNIEIIVNAYIKQELKDEDIVSFRNQLSWRDFLLSKEFESQILKNTSYNFEKKLFTDDERQEWNQFHKDKEQLSFNLLFNKDLLIEKIEYFLVKKNLKLFSYEDIIDNRKDFYSNLELQKQYPSSFLNCFYDTLRYYGRNVSKHEILRIIDSDLYLMKRIHSTLLSNKNLKVSEEQRKQIKKWCLDNIPKTIFSRVCQCESNSARYRMIWDFAVAFDFKYDENTFLKYLSVDVYNDQIDKLQDYQYIIERVNKEKFNNQIELNFSNPYLSDSSIEKHSYYALKNKLITVYHKIKEFLKDENRIYYNRRKVLEEYIEVTNDINLLKELVLFKSEESLVWDCIPLLIDKGESNFVIQKLLEFLQEAKSENQLLAIKYLVRANYDFAFKLFNQWLIENISEYRKEMNYRLNSSDWKYHTNSLSLPYLIDLIKISSNPHYDFADINKPIRIVHDTLRSICQNNHYDISIEVIEQLKICLSDINNNSHDLFYINTMINDTTDILNELRSNPMSFKDIASKIEELKYEIL
ncbi:hypothetical protein [Xanthomarina gelatinilytica]|uniref:hypothetical protein n=1 Tax=Xanthomarina gelatinilytica TaxID=1137281 RepID=UPI003AA90499